MSMKLQSIILAVLIILDQTEKVLAVRSSFTPHPTAIRLHCNSRYCCYTTCYILALCKLTTIFLDKIRIVTFTEGYTVSNCERQLTWSTSGLIKVKVIRLSLHGSGSVVNDNLLKENTNRSINLGSLIKVSYQIWITTKNLGLWLQDHKAIDPRIL